MAARQFRIAILGLDHWYSAFLALPAFANEPRVEIAGIAHADVSRARHAAAPFGIDRVVADPHALIDDPTVDAVAIFTSTDVNAELCVAAAHAGKTILAAKPIARTLDDATRVLSAVRAGGVTLLPSEAAGGAGRRGPVAVVRELVSDGRLGEVVFARCSTSAGLPQSWPGNPAPGWFADPARCAGGGWIDHAIYEIDRLRWILGREIDSVSADIGVAQHPGLAVEDYGVALARFAGGALAELRADWFLPTTAMFQSEWMLTGTDAIARVDDVANRVTLARVPPAEGDLGGWKTPGEDPALPRELDVPPVAGFPGAVTHLVRVLAGEETPVADVEDAWKNLAVAVAVYEAARSHQSVRVREVPAP